MIFALLVGASQFIGSGLQVGLECGSEEELSGVNELERCGYTARLATPAVCTVEGYQAVLNELESIEEQMAVNSEL